MTVSDRRPVAPGHEFRRHWQHLADLVWLNTPSIAPAADAVAAALWRAIDRWQRGERVIDDWEDDVEAFNTEEDAAAVLAALRHSGEPQRPELRQERLASAKRGAHRLADP